MRWIRFILLFKWIFGKKLPDLEKIQKQGLLAVKIGQTFALRIDFLEEEKTTHLAKLYSHNTPIGVENYKTLLASYTSKAWLDQFEFIEDEPIGTASVGQVHKAKLKTGEDVVVKFLKKDFKKHFKKDVDSFRRFVKFIIFFYPKLAKVADPIGIIEHIEEYTLAELDLRNEISNEKVLKDIYQKYQVDYDLSRLKFPKIYEDLSNENVLVSEYLHGETLDTLLERKEIPYRDLLEVFHIHGFFIFLIGTFHGDLHPGNLIYQDQNFYFIDTGALSTVGKKIQHGLYEFMRNLSLYDFSACAHGLNAMAEKEIHGAKFDKFHQKILELYADFEGSTVSEISLTKRMMQTIRLGVLSGMEFEKGMFSIIKSMMYLDGMVIKGNPQAKLMEDMRDFIAEFDVMEAKLRHG